MSENNHRLFLLDAYALIYRAHFAFIRNPRITTTGMNTSAVFGFTTTLLDVLNREKPTHIAIVYDTAAPTFRHQDFEAYKANRQEQPEDISIAIPYIKKLAEAFGIPSLHLDGYEADDIIGTLAKKGAAKGYTVYMMTPDKDFGQLVEKNILQYKPAYQQNPAEILGINEICQRWDVDDPLKVIDVLGLMGDSIDNIPGIPGVGEKTAKKLIHQFGSVEAVVANAEKIPGKLGEKVRENAELALLSKKLATICIDCPIELDEESLVLSPRNDAMLAALFTKLEFRTLGKRLLGEDLPAVAPPQQMGGLFGDMPVAAQETATKAVPPVMVKTIADYIRKYELVTDERRSKEVAEYVSRHPLVSFDTETSNVDPHDCDMVGFSVSVQPGEAFYIATPGGCREDRELLEAFRPMLESEKTEKTGQNIKFDMLILAQLGIHLKGPMFDTMIAHYLIEPDSRHGMDLLAVKYLGYQPIPIEELIGSGRKQLSMAQLPPEKITDYACEDADVVLQLENILRPLLKEANAWQLYQDVEMPLIHVLADMELEGVGLDKEALFSYSVQLGRELAELEIKIYELAGVKFNINSPIQLGEILFEKLKLDPNAKRTSKSKQYSTGDEILSKLVTKHDIVRKIQDYRQLTKLKSTYIDALPTLVNKRTGRVHTSFNQAVAATGRLSSTDPNLQNIPIRTERGREIRKAFVPREGHVLLSADYSQIELRLMAEISGDEAMMEAFVQGQDIHTATAAKIFAVKPEDVTGDMRRKAKMVNFGIIYGISAFGLAQRLEISRTEAAAIIEAYNRQYPRIRQYMHDQMAFARANGYVQTLMGRRRYLRDINSGNATVRGYAERNAINAPIQGSAADMIKLAMINIHRAFKEQNLGSKMILQVHDELVFDVRPHEMEQVKSTVADKMRTALPTKVPIEVESGTGTNWLEAH